MAVGDKLSGSIDTYVDGEDQVHLGGCATLQHVLKTCSR